jgi:tol-pal system protein YbgF
MKPRNASFPLVMFVLAMTVFAPLAAHAQGTRGSLQPLTQPPAGQNTRPPAHAAAAAPSEDGAVARRLERMEERLTDIQSQTAALETMLNSGGGIPAAPGGGGGDADMASRLTLLETQMQAMSNQLADIMQKLQQMDGQSGGVAPAPGRHGALPDQNSFSAPSRMGAADSGMPPAGNQAQQPRMTFSTTSEAPETAATVSTGAGRYPTVAASALPPVDGQDGAPVRQASLSTPTDARSLYDQGYATLVKREYRAADAYFTQFLQQYPNDPLAGAAQYWLGESAFVSGDYRRAADMFLKSYTSYPSSEKAPESLLKLGMSLKRLGQGGAACDTFAELERKFPQAHTVIQREQAEKKRSNCGV